MESNHDASGIELIEMENSIIRNTTNILTCDQKNVTIYNNNVKILGKSLFIHMRNTENNEQILKIMDLSSDNRETCIPVATADFGKHKIFTYEIENSLKLIRYTVTPEADLIDRTEIGTTEFVGLFPLKLINVIFSQLEVSRLLVGISLL